MIWDTLLLINLMNFQFTRESNLWWNSIDFHRHARDRKNQMITYEKKHHNHNLPTEFLLGDLVALFLVIIKALRVQISVRFSARGTQIWAHTPAFVRTHSLLVRLMPMSHSSRSWLRLARHCLKGRMQSRIVNLALCLIKWEDWVDWVD